MRNSAAPARSRVFISYRREDGAGHVLALLPALRARYGGKRVFKDTDDIPPGVNFREFIQHELASCSVFLAIIGREWLTLAEPRSHQRRLDDPDDFLRIEVATALENERIRVIPVLVEHATMPSEEDLPPNLAELAFRNAFELSDTRWDSDVERLIHAIDEALDSTLSNSERIRARLARRMRAVTHVVRSTSRHLMQPSRVRRFAAAGTIVLSTSATVLFYSPGFWPDPAGGIPSDSLALPEPTVAVPAPSAPPPANASADTPVTTPPASTDDALGKQLEQPRQSARDRLSRGQRSQALDSIAAGLALDPKDAGLLNLRDSMLAAAGHESETARTRARSAGADTQAAALFGQAVGLEEEAERNRHGSVVAAIRTYWRAAERFDHARTRAGELAKTSPPSSPPAPAPWAAPPTAVRNDRTRITDLIAQYERGYNDMNVAAIRAVYPAAPDYLQKEFDKYIKYGLTILCADGVKLDAGGTTATAKCRFYHVMQPKDLATKVPQGDDRQEFLFQKQDGQWIISRLRRW